MAAKQLESWSAVDSFLIRNGLGQNDMADCYEFVKHHFPGSTIEVAACQGYCSLTFFVGDDTIVQFRPRTYKLDLLTVKAARKVYRTFAPQTTYVDTLPKSGLLVYTMSRLQGVSYKEFRTSSTMLRQPTEARATLCKNFAHFLSMGWNTKNTNIVSQGVIGSSLLPRIELLSKQLPLRFRPVARKILKNIDMVGSLPWVLTHGDIVASNIIIDAATGSLVGFVDWAEGEPLPFGVCLYGLEEILGEMTSTGFQYDKDAPYLRQTFWTELMSQIPELNQDPVMEAVKMARDLGVLLWHGIAFDDGAINRVVEEGRDIEEIRRLDAFLDIDASASSSASSSLSMCVTEESSSLSDECSRARFCDLRAGAPLVTNGSF
ncbi:kinase-like domain protein [Rutstroemia sp. NJR-2017a BVV2]|nr:kinase-like domain protein [Rutstroemia sp. NJR-2017a BVV2]